jgi:hypothetical protein
MNLAETLDLENTMGRLRAVECALQALILTHPDPTGFGEILCGLVRSAAARPERDGGNPFVETSDGFRAACEEFRRAAEVAISTAARQPPRHNGHAHGDGGAASGHAP